MRKLLGSVEGGEHPRLHCRRGLRRLPAIPAAAQERTLQTGQDGGGGPSLEGEGGPRTEKAGYQDDGGAGQKVREAQADARA